MIIYWYQYARAIFWRVLRKLRIIKASDSIIDQQKDRMAPFDEHPPCEYCGSISVSEKIIVRDGSRIVECDGCGLMFTSPRIKESTWMNYLKDSSSERSIEFTENRIKYGVALSSNIIYSGPNWFSKRMSIENAFLDSLEDHLGAKIKRLHDVGCGVGFTLRAANERGIESSGNELNGYACEVMKERFGLNVYNDILPELDIESNSVDVITLNDYIEHTYHPFADLKAAFNLLRHGGLVKLTTFHIDCNEFRRLGGDWNCLFWNHVYHFSIKSLENMITKAGFTVIDTNANYGNGEIKVIARK